MLGSIYADIERVRERNESGEARSHGRVARNVYFVNMNNVLVLSNHGDRLDFEIFLAARSNEK